MKVYKTAAIAIFFSIMISLFLKIDGQEIFLPDNPLEGARVFEQKGCILCHAINNQGGKGAPDLGKELFHGEYLELASLMWNHFPKMKSEINNLGIDIPVFSQGEFEDLFAYLFCISFQGEPGNEKRGEELLRQKQCLKCHTGKDSRKFSAPDLKKMAFYSSPIFLAQVMWNHSPKMTQKMKQLRIQRPNLSGEEITDIAAYLQSISAGGIREKVYMRPGNAMIGAKIFEVKKCGYCHSKIGKQRGIPAAPDLSLSEGSATVTELVGALWNHGGQMALLMDELNIPWPKFTGQEMADLIAYISYLKFNNISGDHQKGRGVFQSKNCSVCHILSEKLKSPAFYSITPIKSSITMFVLMWNHAPKMDSLMTKTGIDWPVFSLNEMTNLYIFLKETTSENKD